MFIVVILHISEFCVIVCVCVQNIKLRSHLDVMNREDYV